MLILKIILLQIENVSIDFKIQFFYEFLYFKQALLKKEQFWYDPSIFLFIWILEPTK